MHRAKPLRSRGAALLAALLTVTLVATLAAAALWQQWRGVEVEAAERTRAQSAWILIGALDWARLILAEDGRSSRGTASNTDHLAEPWALPLAEARLSTFLAAADGGMETHRDAFLSGQITDLQGRLNLTRLLSAGEEGLQAYLRFERLFSLLGLPASELRLLTDTLKRANAALVAAGGTGTLDASAQQNASGAPLMPQRFEQLAWLGVAPQTLAALRPHVVLLPRSTPVNLNTASAEVIFAAVPRLDMARARQIVSERDRGAFTDPGKALERVGLPADTACEWCSVNSSFFEVRGRLRLDSVGVEEVSVVQRDVAQVRTLWRSRVALTLPDGGAARAR